MAKTITIKRVIGLILYSKIFFLVSCTTGSVQIGKFLSYQQANSEVPKFIQVLAMHGNGDIDYLTTTGAIEKYKNRILTDNENISFLLPEKGGKIVKDEFTTITYTVEVLGNKEQKITVVKIGDEYTKTSIYNVSKTKVTPTYSRAYGIDHFFRASPYALLVSLILYGLGWLALRHDNNKAKKTNVLLSSKKDKA